MLKMYGIGYGQGTWHNEHFDDEQKRDERANELQREIEKKFADDFKGQCGTFTPSQNGTLGISSIVIANKKKNGEFGAFRFTIRRYSYDRPACEYACTPCATLRAQLANADN